MGSMKTEILGIGNPIFDICAHIELDALPFLRTLLPAADWGQTFHVDDARFEKLCAGLHCRAETVLPGGGAFNTIRILAQLGHSTGFVGGLGEVPYPLPTAQGTPPHTAEHGSLQSLSAAAFRNELQRQGIRDCTRSFAGRPCGRSLCLKSGTREILIFNPAAAASLRHLDRWAAKCMALPLKLMYIEGFTLPRRALVRKLLQHSQSSPARVALDLGAAPLVASQKEFILQEVLPAVTYLFGTEDELAALDCDPSDLLRLPDRRAEKSEERTVVVKRGADGSTVMQGNDLFAVPARPAAVKDTTGAGDAYSAFYLSEVLRGTRPARAAEIAAYASARFLSQFGGFLETAEVEAVFNTSRHIDLIETELE